MYLKKKNFFCKIFNCRKNFGNKLKSSEKLYLAIQKFHILLRKILLRNFIFFYKNQNLLYFLKAFLTLYLYQIFFCILSETALSKKNGIKSSIDFWFLQNIFTKMFWSGTLLIYVCINSLLQGLCYFWKNITHIFLKNLNFL